MRKLLMIFFAASLLFTMSASEKGNVRKYKFGNIKTSKEVIVVDKINGETQIKQIKGMNLHGLDMAEVWLSGALGGGTPAHAWRKCRRFINNAQSRIAQVNVRKPENKARKNDKKSSCGGCTQPSHQ